jgi:hypothetical protein
MSEERMNVELTAFEATLGQLQPQPAAVDRDRLMFLAGRAAAARATSRRRVFAICSGPLALAVNLLLAVTLGILLAAHRNPQVVERIVYVSASPRTTTVASDVATPPPNLAFAADGDWGQYLKLRREILSRGLDALPEAASGGSGERESLTPDSGRRGALEKLLQG